MKIFVLNIALAFIWSALWADFSPLQLVVGFHLGFALLWLTSLLFDKPIHYFKRSYRLVRLVLFFLYELILSSFRVAWDVVTPTHLSKPVILHVPLDVKSNIEILLVTNLISLTPGTLSLDVTEDRKTLIVHAMFAEDPDALIAELKHGMERMVRELFE
ncbi:MAG: Na+/H+ antiporter subunit E [Candidatus Dadabacteria bacterium]|nr:Na+/H+ antiporter subunit E [Candidatus Dadabacteria bacterium]MCY4262325.1 Na+/H+ antiporter subunit E [Candidatus Dadabacteria bacterium]